MTLPGRKSEELSRKLASLDEEFDRWEKASGPGGPFQRHHTQIGGVLLPLRVLRRRIAADLEKKSGDAYLGEARKATQLILGIHRIWEFFRQKLAQRQDQRLRKFLQIADEFAWLCYAPVIAKTKIRRPPLVYLNGGVSPFILRRHERFQVEADPGAVVDPEFERVLDQLPFPVIGVPWHQLEYWPEMVVIGHETGHAVERDLKLERALDQAIDAAVGAKSARARYWKAWRPELFADAYGCAAAGPAFVSALADFLANSRAALEDAAPSAQSEYPPTLLRVFFNQCVLEISGLDPKIPGWSYETPQRLAPFVEDAKAVAKNFSRAIKPLLKFSKKQWQAAQDRAKDAERRHAPAAAPKDLRVLIASIRCAFESSPEYWDRLAKAEVPPQPNSRPPAPLDQIRADIDPLVIEQTRAPSDRISKRQEESGRAAADIIYGILSRGLE